MVAFVSKELLGCGWVETACTLTVEHVRGETTGVMAFLVLGRAPRYHHERSGCCFLVIRAHKMNSFALKFASAPVRLSMGANAGTWPLSGCRSC